MGRRRLDEACSRGHKRTRTTTYVQPDGKRICRVCRVIAKTTYVNKKRAAAGLPPVGALSTICRNGHVRTEKNTIIRSSGGSKECLICKREAHRAYRNRKRLMKSNQLHPAVSQDGFTCKETTNDNDRSIRPH